MTVGGTNFGYGSAVVGEAPPSQKRPGEVRMALDDLQTSLKNLQVQLNILNEKLQPILAEATPEESRVMVDKMTGPHCGLAVEITSARATVSMLDAVVGNLNARLEL